MEHHPFLRGRRSRLRTHKDSHRFEFVIQGLREEAARDSEFFLAG